MKSTLKIDEFEIILDGVDDQWLKQNHHHIVDAIIKAFEPFEHREFNDKVIDELVIELPKSNSFNQFLDALLHQLRNEVVDKNIVRKSKSETSEIPKPISNWQTIQNLFDKLKNQSSSNSNLYQQTLNEILLMVQSNENLIWEFISKLGLSRELLETFKNWIITEKTPPNLMVFWLGSFIELQKKKTNESPDAIWIKIIFQSVYNQNSQNLTIANLQNKFVQQLLKIPNPSLEEIIEYQSTLGEFSNIFSTYFNEFDVIRNLINVEFIEKIIQFNTNNQYLSKGSQKTEVLLFFAALKIASSLNIQNYEQLVESLNQAYLTSNRGQFNEQLIAQLFKQYLPTNQHYILASLLEMTFQETKLINSNIDIETSLIQLFTKIERYISDNQNVINDKSAQGETIEKNTILSEEKIFGKIIQFNFFKTWPKEIEFLIPVLNQYFIKIFTTEKAEAENQKFPLPISENGQIAFQELLNIIKKILEFKNKTLSQFQNILFEYGSVINLLLLNSLDLEQPKLLEEEIKPEQLNIEKRKDELVQLKNATENSEAINETIYQIWPNFKEIFNHYNVQSDFIDELIKITKQQEPSAVFNFLSQQINQKFAASFFERLWQISNSSTSVNQYLLLDSLLSWVEFNFNQYQTSQRTIEFNEYLKNTAKIDLKIEKQIQTIKETIAQEITTNIEALNSQTTKEIELEIFTEAELKLWQSFVEHIENNALNNFKLKDQIQYFELVFQIMGEFWMNQQHTSQKNALENQFEKMTSLSKIIEQSYLESNHLNPLFHHEINRILSQFRKNRSFLALIFELQYKQIKNANEAFLYEALQIEEIENSQLFNLDESQKLTLKIFEELYNSNQTNASVSSLSENQISQIFSQFEIFTSELAQNFFPLLNIIAAQFINNPISQKILTSIEILEVRKKTISDTLLIQEINDIQSIAILESIKIFLFDLLNQFILSRSNGLSFNELLTNENNKNPNTILSSIKSEISQIELTIASLKESNELNTPSILRRVNFRSEIQAQIENIAFSQTDKAKILSLLEIEISDKIENQPEHKKNEISQLQEKSILYDEIKAQNKIENPQLQENNNEKQFQEKQALNNVANTDIEFHTKIELHHLKALFELQNQINVEITNHVESLNQINVQPIDAEIIQKWKLFEESNQKPINLTSIFLGDILLKISKPWFQFLSRFSKDVNHSIQIEKHLNWFNQLIEQNVILTIQPSQNNLLQKYLQEIVSFSIQNYGLKEHLYIQNVFELIIQFFKQNKLEDLKIPVSISAQVAKNIDKLNAIFKSALELHHQILSNELIQIYTQRSEIDIATESKNILQQIFKSENLEESEWTPKNIWFQTENKISIAALFNENEFWRILFSDKLENVYIQNDVNSIAPIWNQTENLKVLLRHPESKKWMVELSKNKGEGFMDLASTLSFESIVEAHQEKYKSPNFVIQNIQPVLDELKKFLSTTALLEFYQFTKFQILQTQSPLTKVYLSQIYYLSYLSVVSKKTFPEISQFTKIIFEKLELNEFEKGIIQKFINEKLPTQSSTETSSRNEMRADANADSAQLTNPSTAQNIIENGSGNEILEFLNESKPLSTQTKEYFINHIAKYPNITEFEFIEQIQLVSNIQLNISQSNALLKALSIEIWQRLNNSSKTATPNLGNAKQFLFKTVSNWLKFKLVHFTIKYAYPNIETWINESKQILLDVDIHKINNVHVNWLLYDEKVKSEFSPALFNPSLFLEFSPNNIGQINAQTISNIVENQNSKTDISNLSSDLTSQDNQLKNIHVSENTQNEKRETPHDSDEYSQQNTIEDQVPETKSDLKTNNQEQIVPKSLYNPLEIAKIENEVIIDLIRWQEEINSKLNVPQKKAIENQQNKEETKLELSIHKRDPDILDWEQLNTSDNIINSIITILLKEGINLKTQSKYQEEFISVNQFLSSKAFYRILGNSSIPLQFIGLMYEQFFGYSMGFIEESWTDFIAPRNSKELVDKLLILNNEKNIPSKEESWFEKLISFATQQEDKPILKVKDFNLILREIQTAIQQKLSNTKFAKVHQSLQESWIQHLIFFKIIQFKTNSESIGGLYAILESDPTKIDHWIHQVSDHILFDITVEYDFWIENLFRFGNYFEESNILTLFQLSESLKLINSENKLNIEDIFEATLKVSESRPFEEAINNVLISQLVPIFYENQLVKTTQFRELNILALIIKERNLISSKSTAEGQEINNEAFIALDEMFSDFKAAETLEINPEILREISMIIGKNLDETSRWILHELAQSDVKKLNENVQKIQEAHQNEVQIKSYYQSIINNPKLTASIQELIAPIIINLNDTKKSDSKIKREIENGTRFITTLCGLMMLSPFLATLFRRMGLLEKNAFVSEKEQLKAYKVLMTIPKLDEEQVYEYQDLIPRIITGIAPEDTIHYVPELTEDELTEIRNFLGAVISQWPVMANATVRGFIESFLVRDGKVWKEGSLWKIEVNGHGADIILQTLTWGFSTMKFPWTPYMIETNWLSP